MDKNEESLQYYFGRLSKELETAGKSLVPYMTGGIVHDVCSLGIRQKKAGLPALFIDPENAISSWYEAALDWIDDTDFNRYRIIVAPKLNKYQITMAEHPHFTHRIVGDYYAVESQFMTEL